MGNVVRSGSGIFNNTYRPLEQYTPKSTNRKIYAYNIPENDYFEENTENYINKNFLHDTFHIS